jgi:predicted oxidoreductase
MLRHMILYGLLAGLGLLLGGCNENTTEVADDAQAIVVGAGIAGLSAALEMGERGVNVLVIDMNSVAGGHAVLAGGIALVATGLQEQVGIEDSASLAYRDWMEWTEDGDPEWTRDYAEHSGEMIFDWLEGLGVEFVRVAPAHGNSVPRFHFTRGRAVHVILPMFRKLLGMPNISLLWNAHVEQLLVEDGQVHGVVVKELRSGALRTLRAPHIVLATGGFESDLARVLENWTPGLPQPDRLLIGSAISATGSGHDMATAAGAALTRIDRHYIYINGVVNPRDPEKIHALTAGNEASMWVNAQGMRFTNEMGFDKNILLDLLQQKPASYWAIFDAGSRNEFTVRGAGWLNNTMPDHPILDNSQAAAAAQSLQELAARTGLPAEALQQSVQRFNALIDSGADTDFDRFQSADAAPRKIEQPPFYAVPMFPMTRKSMGGVAVDRQARALDGKGQVIPGLYAVGELNGSVGINGKHGLDGMFLGPAVLTGRLAGRSIAAEYPEALPAAGSELSLQSVEPGAWHGALNATTLEAMLAVPRDGYWHFQMSHRLVLERNYPCTLCHSAQLPFAPVTDRASLMAQTQVCSNCH